jgi:hypothetical protein
MFMGYSRSGSHTFFYESVSESFYQKAEKIIQKTLISAVY